MSGSFDFTSLLCREVSLRMTGFEVLMGLMFGRVSLWYWFDRDTCAGQKNEYLPRCWFVKMYQFVLDSLHKDSLYSGQRLRPLRC